MLLKEEAFFVGYGRSNGLVALYQEVCPAPRSFENEEDARKIVEELRANSARKEFARDAITDWQVYRMRVEPVDVVITSVHQLLEKARRGD